MNIARWPAAILASALVVLGSVVSISPAAAATGDVVGGTASWGISTYLNAGTFGRPSPLLSAYTAPASYSATTKLSSWGNATGHVSPDGSAALSFSGGSVNFTATGGGWLKFADLQVTLDASANGSVSALVSYGQAPGTYPNISFDPMQAPLRGPERVTIVTLAGNSSPAAVSSSGANWSGLAGTWSADLLAYLQGDGGATPAWGYAATITNDPSVAGPRTALPFDFAVSFEAPKTFNAGTASWGISTYLNAGTFGRPSPLVAGYLAPASYDSTTKLTSWGNATGTLFGDGSATLAYEGTSVNFTATGGGWLRITDPQATLDAHGNGSVTALVSYGQAPGTYPNISYSSSQAPLRGPERVEIVTLAGNSVSVTQTASTASWSALEGTWSAGLLAYLQGDGGSIPAWGYAATITNDPTVAGPRTALPFSFSLGVTPLVATTTTLTGTTVDDNLTVTATISPALAGSVRFSNGSTALATVPAAGGVATHTITAAPPGGYALTAQFTPADAAHYASSTATLSYSIAAPVPAAVGSLSWGVKQSLQTYVLSGGSISTGGGAGYTGARFSFPQLTTAFDHGAGSGSSSYGGKVTFAYPDHGFSIGIANPRVQIASATSATLFADITYNGATRSGVAFATLGLGSRTTTGTSSTYSNVSATLTAAGASAFQGFYSAGEALDPMSFVIGAPSAGFAAVTKSVKSNEPDATPPATEGIESETDAVEGESFSATASGFAPKEEGILVVIYSEPMLLDTISADDNGVVRWNGELPQGLTGEHTLTFQGSVDRGMVLDIAPSELLQSAACLVDSGDLSWGFKESFRSYISGTIANGEWTVADGATYETPLFGFSGATGSYDSGVGEINFAGSITFTGHDGILNTTVANPAIRFDDADTAYLLLDVSGTTQQGDAVAQQAVKFVRLDLPAATVNGSTVTFTDAAAELTADGSAAFGTYEADEPFDPVTVSFTTAADCTDVPLPINPVPIDEGVTPPTSPDTGWIIWLIVGIAALAAIGVVLVRLARR